MNVLVDTSVWSLALRRREVDEESEVVRELRELIAEGSVVMIGPIRQELLSGIRKKRQFNSLRDHLRAFPDLPLSTIDFERAAEHFTTCRMRGIQGSNTDFLICAVSERLDLSIFTTDGDYVHFSDNLPIHLHRVRFDESS
jgi:predicted nucleic acid-binding protein